MRPSAILTRIRWLVVPSAFLWCFVALGSDETEWATPGVTTLAQSPDGKMVLAGRISGANGVTLGPLVRLNVDGSIDPTFSPPQGQPTGEVFDLSVFAQSTGKSLVSGHMYFPGANLPGRITRLNRDGTVDPTFQVRNVPVAAGEIGFALAAIALRPDDYIIALVSGFISPHSFPRKFVLLDADGNFVQDLTIADPPNRRFLGIQPDGKLLYLAPDANGLAQVFRYNLDGTLDQKSSSLCDCDYNFILLQPDGGIIASEWGSWTIFRLKPDLTTDSTYKPSIKAPGGNGPGAVFDSTGKLMIWGSFTNVNGVAVSNIARLNLDGTLDTSFVPSSDLIEIFRQNSTVERFGAPLPSLATGRGLVFAVFQPGYPLERIIRVTQDGSIDRSFSERLDASSLNYYSALHTGGFRSNAFYFTVEGPANRLLRIESSTDLQSWSFFKDIVIDTTSSSNLFSQSEQVDLTANQSNRKFYRVLSQ